jgi:hypothetical protein
LGVGKELKGKGKRGSDSKISLNPSFGRLRTGLYERRETEKIRGGWRPIFQDLFLTHKTCRKTIKYWWL